MENEYTYIKADWKGLPIYISKPKNQNDKDRFIIDLLNEEIITKQEYEIHTKKNNSISLAV